MEGQRRRRETGSIVQKVPLLPLAEQPVAVQADEAPQPMQTSVILLGMKTPGNFKKQVFICRVQGWFACHPPN